MATCSTEGSKQHVNENIDLQSDRDLAVFLMQLLLKALRICLVCLIDVIIFIYNYIFFTRTQWRMKSAAFVLYVNSSVCCGFIFVDTMVKVC